MANKVKCFFHSVEVAKAAAVKLIGPDGGPVFVCMKCFDRLPVKLKKELVWAADDRKE